MSIQSIADALRGRRMLDFYRAILVYGAATLIGIIAGVVSGGGRLSIIAIFTGLIVATGVALSRKALLWFVVIGGLVVFGLAQLYLPEAKYIRYVVPLAAAGLILHGVMDRLTSAQQVPVQTNMPMTLGWALAFALIAVVSSLVNRSDVGVTLMGLKGYFQMWPLLLALLLVRWTPDTLSAVLKGLLVIAFLQLPFVAHQYFVLVPLRVGIGEGIVPVDVVSGTFGATLYGGGANAVLAAYMIAVFACLLGLWKYGAISTTGTTVAGMALLAPLFVNEAKISVLYIVLAYVILFYKEIAAKPAKTLLAGLAVAAIFAALLTALTLAQPSGKFSTWSELIEFTIERQTASMANRSGQFSELGRWTALTFWAGEHMDDSLAHLLLGHGPGASRVQEGGLDLASTLAERRYEGLQIGYTGLSALLWDTGILGAAAVIGMFVAAFTTAHRLASCYRVRSPAKAGLFDGLSAAVAIFALSLVHKDFFAFHIPYQTLLVLILGYLLIAERELPSADRSG